MNGYLFITGLIFAAVGLYALLDPVAALGQPLGLHIEAVNSFNQLRGSAGGVPLAVGIFLVISARKPALARPALWTVALLLGGLELGRLASIAIDGLPSRIIWIYMGAEIFGLVQAVFWLRRPA